MTLTHLHCNAACIIGPLHVYCGCKAEVSNIDIDVHLFLKYLEKVPTFTCVLKAPDVALEYI